MTKQELEKLLFEMTGKARHEGKKSLWLSGARFDLIRETITSLTVSRYKGALYFNWNGIKVIRQPDSNIK